MLKSAPVYVRGYHIDFKVNGEKVFKIQNGEPLSVIAHQSVEKMDPIILELGKNFV
jgi:hypothetical protein